MTQKYTNCLLKELLRAGAELHNGHWHLAEEEDPGYYVFDDRRWHGYHFPTVEKALEFMLEKLDEEKK